MQPTIFDTFSTSVDSRLIRKMPAAYSDGVYMMAGQDRPSPRKLSQLFMQGDDGLPSVKNRTALFAFFGENPNIPKTLLTVINASPVSTKLIKIMGTTRVT